MPLCLNGCFFMLSKQTLFKQRGVTLLELMLSLLISSMVLAAFMMTSKGFTETSLSFQKDIRTQLSIRSFIEQINTHANQAGYQPPDSIITAGIKTTNPFYLNNTSSNPGVLVDVSNLQFVFDSSTTKREYATYRVLPNIRKSRTEKKIVITQYNTTGWILNPEQDVLVGVKDFKCSFRNIGGTPRALDCYLSVYQDFAPNINTIDYAFTLATTQSF